MASKQEPLLLVGFQDVADRSVFVGAPFSVCGWLLVRLLLPVKTSGSWQGSIHTDVIFICEKKSLADSITKPKLAHILNDVSLNSRYSLIVLNIFLT